jgi:hypothetical protein
MDQSEIGASMGRGNRKGDQNMNEPESLLLEEIRKIHMTILLASANTVLWSSLIVWFIVAHYAKT